MSLFKRQLPTKRKNARGNAELRSANGSINVASFDFNEILDPSKFKQGHSGHYLHGTSGVRPVITEQPEFAESTLSDKTDMTIKVSPAMKNLHAQLSNHVETAIEGLTVQQVRDLRKVFNDKRNQNAADELAKLRNLDVAPTAKQRTRRMELETHMAALKTVITRICRVS